MQHRLSPTTRLLASISSSFLIGLLFGVGLIVAGMSNPAKVLGFLDLAGSWDPSLGLVMLSAICCAAPGFALAKSRHDSLLELPIQLPVAKQADRTLILGSVIFGIGWGIAGICPGPAIVLIGAGLVKAVWFVVAMAAGMVVYELWKNWQIHQTSENQASHKANS